MLWRQQLKTWAPQILHAHDGRGQTLAWLASMGLPVRRVASRRVTFFPSDRWTYRLKYGRTCHAVVAVSENIRDLSVQAGVPRERITVIPDGIEIPAELPSATREGCACEHRGNATMMISWWAYWAHPLRKRARTWRLRPSRCSPKNCPARDWSSPAMKPPARRQLNSTNSWPPEGTEVLRLGPIENLADFFPGLDLFVMPSKAEGLGSSALWAMAYGLPVVATRVGGLPEIVVENETGWLIPPGSPQALADAILLASRDRAKLIEFGRNGRKRAEGFSAAIMVSRTEALYHRLVSGGQQ